jgi:hypothetical protein
MRLSFSDKHLSARRNHSTNSASIFSGSVDSSALTYSFGGHAQTDHLLVTD